MQRKIRRGMVAAICPVTERLEQRALLAAVNWDGGGDGTTWNDPVNWSGNVLPTSADDVTLNVGASPTIVLTGAAAAIRSLASSENLKVLGTTITITNGATLNAPTQVAGGGTFNVEGGMTTNNVFTIGDATDNSFGLLQFNGLGQTLGGSGSVNSAGTNYAYFYNSTLNAGVGDTLTIAPTIELNFGAYVRLTNSYGSGKIQNNGQINAVGNGTTSSDVLFAGVSTTVVNNGTMTLTNGAAVTCYNLVNNAGHTIGVTDSTLILQDDGITGLSWDNNGTITATNSQISAGGRFVFADVGTINRTGGAFNIVGTLDNTSSTLTLNNNTGSWVLASTGRIIGGTVTATGSNTLDPKSGILENVTLNTPIVVDEFYSLNIETGLTLNSTITLGGAIDNSYGVLQFQGASSITVNGAGTINAAGTNYAFIYNGTYDTGTGLGGTLTFNSNFVINLKSYGRLLNNTGGGTIVNNGQLNIAGDGTTSSDVQLSNGTTRFTNNGSITITNSAKVLMVNMVNNAGHTISATNSEMTIQDDGAASTYSWDNNGTITAINSRTNLGGFFLFADIGTFNRTAGEVHLVGTLDNTAATLTLNNTTGSWFLSQLGRILNGTVTATGTNRLIPSNGILDNVTLTTPLQIDQQRALNVQNGLVLNTVITIGNATDNSYGVLQFNGEAQTVSGSGSIDSAGTNYAYFYHYGFTTATGAGNVLTIGASIEINFGPYVRMQVGYGQGSIVNNGQLNLTGNGTANSDIIVANGTTSYVNNGSVNITNGARATITNLVNNASHTVTVTDSLLSLADDGIAGPLSWDNNGAIVYTNSQLQLGGFFVLSDMGTLTRTGGELSVIGTLDNTSTTFTLSNALGDVNLASSGRILNGTVAGPKTLFGRGGTLDGVTLTAPVIIDQSNYLYVEHGVTLNSILTIGGADNSYGVLQFNGASQTFGGTGSVEHVGTGTTYVYNQTLEGAVGGTLTIASGIEINAGRTLSMSSTYTAGQIINNGAILLDGQNAAGVSTSGIGNTSTTFVNNGSINVINKASASIIGIQGNLNTLSTSGIDTVVKIDGTYNINLILNVANRSTVFFDGAWTRTASINVSGTLIFDHDADGGATFNAVKSAVLTGYAANTWTGPGLRDPVAASTPKYTLGYAASSAILGATGGFFNGQFVDETAVIVHHTLDADFNMDNTVTFPDLLKLAQNYGQSNRNFTDGDVDFNGNVLFPDLLVLAQLYGQTSFSATPISTSTIRDSSSARGLLK